MFFPRYEILVVSLSQTHQNAFLVRFSASSSLVYILLNFRSEGMGYKALLMGIFSKETSVLTLIVLENYPLLWYNESKFIEYNKRGFGT